MSVKCAFIKYDFDTPAPNYKEQWSDYVGQHFEEDK